MALVGCVEAPADDADVNDDRTQAISLGDDASVGVFDVVAFDNAKLRIASELRYARCSAQPCEVTPIGMQVPLLPDADGIAGAVGRKFVGYSR